jgi:hypothetical protein
MDTEQTPRRISSSPFFPSRSNPSPSASLGSHPSSTHPSGPTSSRIKRKLTLQITPMLSSSHLVSSSSSMKSIASSPGAKKQAFIKAFPTLALSQETSTDLRTVSSEAHIKGVHSQPKKASNPFAQDNMKTSKFSQKNAMVSWTTRKRNDSSGIPVCW